MGSNRAWFWAWAAISVLWVLYWIGMSMAIGVEAIHEMVAEMGSALLVGALYVSLPACLYTAGSLVGCIARGCKSEKTR